MDRAAGQDIVETGAEAEALRLPPLLVLERVQAYFDEQGLGSGPLRAQPIGDGRSNFTFLIERNDGRFVLRRPPRPPFPASAHDVAREARLQLALAPLGIRVPDVLAVCEDPAVLGVDFYVMEYLEGDVVTDSLPGVLAADPDARRALGNDLIDVLGEIHAVDTDAPAVAAFKRRGNYLERQLRRFTELWPQSATRDLPTMDRLARLLAADLPEPLEETVVHGDFRLGNMIVSADDPTHIVAALDWEMGAIGDPRADLGYLLATYVEPGEPPSPVGGSAATTEPGFPTRAELVERYTARTGRQVERLEWFVAFALWKAAVWCEAIYGRYLRGELAAGDDNAAIFEAGVPLIAEAAARSLEGR